MKNKRLIWTLVFLAILTLGSIGTDLFKKEQQSTHKVAKVPIRLLKLESSSSSLMMPWIKSRKVLRMDLRKLATKGTRFKLPS